jgi:hypothetical protein
MRKDRRPVGRVFKVELTSGRSVSQFRTAIRKAHGKISATGIKPVATTSRSGSENSRPTSAARRVMRITNDMHVFDHDEAPLDHSVQDR